MLNFLEPPDVTNWIIILERNIADQVSRILKYTYGHSAFIVYLFKSRLECRGPSANYTILIPNKTRTHFILLTIRS